MHKIKKVQETKTVEVLEEIICNKCGEHFTYGGGFHGIDIRHSGGCASKIGDGTVVEFAICEVCLIEMFKEFTILPEYSEEGWCCTSEGEVEAPNNLASENTPE